MLEGLLFKPGTWTFDFIKMLAQTLNKISKIWQKKKINLIYAESIQALQ